MTRSMIPLQAVSALFALAMIYWAYLSYRRRTVRLVELILWTLVWGAFAIVVVVPQSTSFFLERLHVNRTLDLMVVLGFMLVWVALFANHLQSRRLRKRLHELVRQVALEEGEKGERR
jgi:hypothetical protein